MILMSNFPERIYFISDIHANLPALDAVLYLIYGQGPDPKIYSLGDDVGYGPYPKETLDVLIETGIESVPGNHDRPIARDEDIFRANELTNNIAHWTHDRLKQAGKMYLDYLNSDRLTRGWEFGNRNIILGHGSTTGDYYKYILEWKDMYDLFEWMEEPEQQHDISIVGHTHQQLLCEERYSGNEPKHKIYRLKKDELPSLTHNKGWESTDEERYSTYRYRLDPDKKYIINPGSVGKTRDKIPRAAFAYLEKDNDDLSVVFVKLDYDIPKLIGRFYRVNAEELMKKPEQVGSPLFPEEEHIVKYLIGK